jgi:hypothetical protein
VREGTSCERRPLSEMSLQKTQALSRFGVDTLSSVVRRDSR